MPEAVVIANPISGNARLQAIRRALDSAMRPPWTYRLHLFAPGAHVRRIVDDSIASGAACILVAGGDGTVRAVAECLVGSDVPLAILPEGTANVLAHDTGIPLHADEALALVVGPHDILQVDAIQVGRAYAFLNLSIGLSAGIIRDTHSGDKRRFGMLAYIWSGAKNLLAVGVQDVRLILDGQERRLRATEVLVANCPSLGASELRVDAAIDPADGALQVIAFRARHLVDYLVVGEELLFRRPRTRRHIQVYRVKQEVEIHTDGPRDVQADGDLIGCTPATARLVPAAIRLIVPPGRGTLAS